MTNPNGKIQKSQHENQEQLTTDEIDEIVEIDGIDEIVEIDEIEEIEDIELNYDGITWVKYKFNNTNPQESIKKECTVIFPLESNKWIWNYTLLGKNKTILVDGEEYKIIGFSWHCYDGIMKKNSSIQIQKI